MIHTLTLNPALDKTVRVDGFAVDAVNRVASVRTDAGGKGINVSKSIAALGGTSRAVAVFGGETGSRCRRLLAEQGLTVVAVETDGETRTNLKIVDPVNGQNTDVNEPGTTMTADILSAATERLLCDVREGDTVVLAGSVPSGAPRDVYATLTRRCRERGASVFLDADGVWLAEGVQAHPTLVKPNAAELSRLAGRVLTTRNDVLAQATRLVESGVETVVVTLGGDGALAVTAHERLLVPGLRVPVESTVGAGDSFVAALAVAREQGQTLAQAMALATATAAATVSLPGTQAASWEAVQALLPRVTVEIL